MIQQIKNNKTDKQLTQNDLKRITCVSCLNFFHTNNLFSDISELRIVVECYYAKYEIFIINIKYLKYPP